MILHDPTTAIKVSSIILDRGVLLINFNAPFKWASGIISPVYCDNRRIFSVHAIRNIITGEIISCIRKNWLMFDGICGVATGGIPPAVLVAHYLQTNFLYVRPLPKSHGLKSQIEGLLTPDIKSIVLVEDLISSGTSSMNAISALRNAGLNVLGVVCVFHYNFPFAIEKFKKEGIPVIALTTFEVTLQTALKSGKISVEDFNRVMLWYKQVKEPTSQDE